MFKKIKFIVSMLMILGILGTSVGIESFAEANQEPITIQNEQIENIEKELTKNNIPESKQEIFIEKVKSGEELESSKFMKNNNLELEVNLDDNETKSVFKKFDDGSYISIEVEDTDSSQSTQSKRTRRSVRKALTYNGKKISASNGVARQTYYINTRPHKNYPQYTVLTKAYGIHTSIMLGTVENEKIRKHRTWEDKNNSIWVEGYAKFNYFGNQWLSVWQQTGGVRTKIKNGKLHVSLY